MKIKRVLIIKSEWTILFTHKFVKNISMCTKEKLDRTLICLGLDNSC